MSTLHQNPNFKRRRNRSKISSSPDLVGGGICVAGRGETDAGVRGVEDAVEALDERLAVDKVKTLSRRRAEVVHDRVDRAAGAADVSVERPWPNLAVGGQRICDLEVRYQERLFDRTSRMLTEPMLKLRFSRASY